MLNLLATAALFTCQVERVTDGDTFRCADQSRVRLASIDAPEVSGCHGKRGRVCVPGNGQASRDTLARMALGRTLMCQRTGTSYRRVVARCSVGGQDLSCAMVKAGQAVVRYGRLEGCR